MLGERPGHSLSPTALVNEAYLRLVAVKGVTWQDRKHFFAMSARLMRRILVDIARSKGYRKRGGGTTRVVFEENLVVAPVQTPDLAALDDALVALAAFDDRKARVVELRYFGGLSVGETASVVGVSEETVTRDWKIAKAWLSRELRGETPVRGAGPRAATS